MRAFTCGSRKDWRWVFSCFFCSRGTLVSHTKFQTSSCLFFSHIARSSRAARKTYASTYKFTLSRPRRKPFPRFYILDEIPAALCPFITFANQMMSLDILRLGFIVAFYAGRTASVKRIRAERSRLIGYHIEIRSLSRSRFLDRQAFFFFFSRPRENQLYSFIAFILPDISWQLSMRDYASPVHAYLFTISLCALHASRNQSKTFTWMVNHGFWNTKD